MAVTNPPQTVVPKAPVPESLDELLKLVVARGASDLHLTPGLPPILRINGKLVPMPYGKLRIEDTKQLIFAILDDRQKKILEESWDLDCSHGIPNVARFRVNLYKQRGAYGGAFRIIPTSMRSRDELSLPPILDELVKKNNGFILVTGSTGQGKSTTLAYLVNTINNQRQCHIVTIEDPIEFVFTHKRSMVNQREMGSDTQSWPVALRAALREDPDVLMIGEMRDPETISTALTAAETGHLVLSTLHTVDCPQAIDRMIDSFPPYQHPQVRIQLASVLEAILCMQLVPLANGTGRIPAMEILIATPAVRSLIREGKTHQLYSTMQTGSKYGMRTMDQSLLELYRKKKITSEECLRRAAHSEEMQRLMTEPAEALS